MLTLNPTAYLSNMQLSRLYNLAPQRQFLTQISQKNLIQHLQPIKFQPKLILDLASDNIIDFKQNNLYPKAKIIHLLPYTNNSSKQIYKINFLANLFKKNTIKANTFYVNNLLDIEALNFHEQKFDIIYSNLMLSYQEDLPKILKYYANFLADDGLIIFSIFCMGSALELPFKLPLFDMHDIGDMLLHNGFSNPVVDVQRINLTYEHKNTKALLQDLHAFGLLKPKIKTLQANCYYQYLSNKFELINKINIEICYAHAWKKPINTQKSNIINIDGLKIKK